MSNTVSRGTGRVAMVNVAVEVPLCTVTQNGTSVLLTTHDGRSTGMLLLLRVTNMVAPAGPVSRIVPRVFSPPFAIAGSISSACSLGGNGIGVMTRRSASRLSAPSRALIVALVSAATRRVVTVNVALVAPAGTTIDAGTTATPSLLERRMSTPFAAGAVSVTVASLVAPASAVAGGSEKCDSMTGGGAGVGAAGVSPQAPAQIATRTSSTTREWKKGRIIGSG